MPTYLDLANWPRRELFEFFRDFDKPYFNICTRLDVTNLLAELRNHPDVSASLAYHYFALKAANEVEQFRYRLRNGQVLVHDVINGGTTLLLPNETFTLVYFDYADTFAEFIGPAQRAVEETKTDGAFRATMTTPASIAPRFRGSRSPVFHTHATGAARLSAEDLLWQVHARKRSHADAVLG